MNTGVFESLTGETDRDFPEYDRPPPEPIGLVQRWLVAATSAGVREPRALALATSDAHGRASNRIVAITALTERGLVFTTHATSQKARDLAATGWGSGLLYWRETGQQLALSGPVTRLSDAEVDALWCARPTPLHSMSTASRQSDPLADVEALRAEDRRLAALGTPLPRPERFVGFCLEPVVVEFWCASSDRLHRRLRYDRTGSTWRSRRLQP